MKKSQFLEKLRKLREDAGKTIVDVAEYSNVIANSISQMEVHGRRISCEKLRVCYFPLCNSDEERFALLVSWAAWKDDEAYWYENNSKTRYDCKLEELTAEYNSEKSKLLADLQAQAKWLNTELLTTLIETAKLITTNPHLKDMLNIYLDATKK